MSTNQIDLLYDQAIESLKRVNNQLFYDELKTNLEKHENLMEREYQQVQNLLEDWKTTIESVPVNLSLKVEDLNKHYLNMQEENLEKLNEDVRALYQEKQQAFEQILIGMGKFQKNLQTIYKVYKELYEKQNKIFEVQVANQQFQLNVFKQDIETIVTSEYKQQQKILEEKLNEATSHFDILIDAKQVENNQVLQEHYRRVNELAVSQDEKQENANRQLIEYLQEQTKKTENKY